MAKIDSEIGNGAKSSQINLLPRSLLRITRARGDQCREVSDSVDLVVRQKTRAEGREIKPLIGRSANATIIEVESVHVDVGLQSQKKQKPLDCSGGLAPLARRLGGDMTTRESKRAAMASCFLRVS